MIRERISQALKDAMRAKDEAKTTTLRTVNAAIKQKDIDVARARGSVEYAAGADQSSSNHCVGASWVARCSG